MTGDESLDAPIACVRMYELRSFLPKVDSPKGVPPDLSRFARFHMSCSQCLFTFIFFRPFEDDHKYTSTTNHNGQFFLPDRSQRDKQFCEWHETWQDNCLTDSSFFGGGFTVLIDIVTSQIVSKFGAKI